MRFLSRLSVAGLLGALLLNGAPAQAMTMKVAGDQIILSGDVRGGDYGDLVAKLRDHPDTTTIVLRQSNGGDAKIGYQIGELIRNRGLRTVLSGECWSSCSRMFLGGATRYFSSDYPIEYTHVSFHAHYKQGLIDAGDVARLGLYDWIIKYSDGKADPELVRRWTSISRSNGAAHFFPPSLEAIRGHATFICEGTEKSKIRMFGCEPVYKNALDVGVITSLEMVQSNDVDELHKGWPPIGDIRQDIDVKDMTRFPLKDADAVKQYELYLAASSPKVFALEVGGSQYAWNGAKDFAKSATEAVDRCQARSKGKPCVVYALDDHVVAAGN